MKYSFLLSLIYLFSLSAQAQSSISDNILSTISPSSVEAHVTFLAADDLKGRDTGSPELEIAAQYIASWFEQNGLKRAPGYSSFFQAVSLTQSTPPSKLKLRLHDHEFTLPRDVLFFTGKSISIQSEVIFLGYGTKDDFQGKEIKGKIVVCLAGTPEDTQLSRMFQEISNQKNRLAKDHGAAALVEIISLPGVSFEGLGNYFRQKRITLDNGESPIPHVLLRNITETPLAAKLKTAALQGSLEIEGAQQKKITGRNVVALVEGNDSQLKNEYVAVTAHYDHIGVGQKNAEGDSIFNGARDNALGTTALLSAAKFLAQNRPARSVIFIACTAEEKGLLGSKWYTQSPAVPLRQTVFNLNADGGGYNDTTIVTINGLEFTETEALLREATSPFAVTAMKDPVPDFNLYAGSDNYRFAEQGIPAINFAPGIKAFDAEIMKYYHQLSDHSSSLNFRYVTNYVHSFVHAVYLLGTARQVPGWKPDSPYQKPRQ